MRFVGSILLWSFAVLWGAILAVAGLGLFVVFNPWVDPKRRAMAVLDHLWGKGLMLVLWGIHVEVRHRERLAGGPYVICPNHYSYADIIAMLGVMPPFKFVAKWFLFFLPPAATHMRMSGHVRQSLGEEGGVERVTRQCLAWLEKGVNILIFPESTRSTTLEVQRFKPLPFKLAQAAGVKVVPVAISGTHDVLPKGSFRYRFHAYVIIDVLEPIEVVGDPRTVAAEVRARIAAAVSRQQAEGRGD